MKQLIILLSVVILFFGNVNSANYVEVDIGGEVAYGDTLIGGNLTTFTISIENDVKLGGIALPFQIYSPDGVTWELYDYPHSQFAPATPYGGAFVSGMEGSRWMSGDYDDGGCWDIGGTLVNDYLAPDKVMVGGAAIDGGLQPGELEHMLNIHFIPHAFGGDEVKTLCIDSTFYPPSGEFIFEPGGRPASNLPRCWPVVYT
jgi:hypothetical protein